VGRAKSPESPTSQRNRRNLVATLCRWLMEIDEIAVIADIAR